MRLHRAPTSVLSACLGVAVLLAACGGSSTDNGGGGGGPAPTRVQGKIEHAGAGVSGVQVFLRDGPAADRMVTTGASGSYQFDAVAPGDWELAVEVPGYFELAAGQAAERPVTVTAEQTLTVDIPLDALIADDMQSIELKDSSFDPNNLTVAPGTVVRFTNTVSVAHNVTPTGHSQWSARGLSSMGSQTDITLNNPGTWAFQCTLYPGMTGTLQVVVP